MTNRRREAGIVAIYACFITRVDRKRSRDKNSTNHLHPITQSLLLSLVFGATGAVATKGIIALIQNRGVIAGRLTQLIPGGSNKTAKLPGLNPLGQLRGVGVVFRQLPRYPVSVADCHYQHEYLFSQEWRWCFLSRNVHNDWSISRFWINNRSFNRQKISKSWEQPKMSDRLNFLYPRCRYYGQMKPHYLVFNANLQEFAQRVTTICNLQTSGKLPPEQAYEQIQDLWQQLQESGQHLLDSD